MEMLVPAQFSKEGKVVVRLGPITENGVIVFFLSNWEVVQTASSDKVAQAKQHLKLMNKIV